MVLSLKWRVGLFSKLMFDRICGPVFLNWHGNENKTISNNSDREKTFHSFFINIFHSKQLLCHNSKYKQIQIQNKIAYPALILPFIL